MMKTDIDAMWSRLLAGNQRFHSAHVNHPNQTVRRRQDVANEQHPTAVILSCSDSRVPPEIIFDQGLGDLFVIRVAGNIVTAEVLGSIEYAVEHLHVPLIVVLGHQRCGAVAATVNGGEPGGHIGSLTHAIVPAVDRVKQQPGDLADNAVRSNVKLVVEQLGASAPILSMANMKGEIKIVGAYYNLESGVVEAIA